MNKKQAALRYYRDRLQTYRLTPKNRDKEKETVRQILGNNKCDPLPIILEHTGKKQNHNTQTQKCMWARFTYVGKETRFITKLFEDTNITVACTTNNTIGKRLSIEHKTQCKYDKSRVYQLTRPDCKMTYTEQTGRPFKIRFQEHMREFKYNNRRSKFAQNLLEKGHAIGKNGRHNEDRPRHKERKNAEHIRKLPHIQGDQGRKQN